MANARVCFVYPRDRKTGDACGVRKTVGADYESRLSAENTRPIAMALLRFDGWNALATVNALHVAHAGDMNAADIDDFFDSIDREARREGARAHGTTPGARYDVLRVAGVPVLWQVLDRDVPDSDPRSILLQRQATWSFVLRDRLVVLTFMTNAAHASAVASAAERIVATVSLPMRASPAFGRAARGRPAVLSPGPAGALPPAPAPVRITDGETRVVVDLTRPDATACITFPRERWSADACGDIRPESPDVGAQLGGQDSRSIASADLALDGAVLLAKVVEQRLPARGFLVDRADLDDLVDRTEKRLGPRAHVHGRAPGTRYDVVWIHGAPAVRYAFAEDAVASVAWIFFQRGRLIHFKFFSDALHADALAAAAERVVAASAVPSEFGRGFAPPAR